MDWLKKLENVKNFYQEPGFVLPEPGPTEQDDKIELETYGWDFMSPKSTGPREGSTVPEFKDALTEKLVPELGVSYKSPKGWSVGAGPWAGESDPSINFQFRKEFDDGGVATPKRGLVDGPGSYAGKTFEPNISIFEDIVLEFNQGSEYKSIKDVFQEYYKKTKDPFAKAQAVKGVTRGSKAEKLIQPVLSLLETVVVFPFLFTPLDVFFCLVVFLFVESLGLFSVLFVCCLTHSL